MATYDAYVICTAPRSGSTLLCSLLAATGVAGKPQSYFFDPSVADWIADLGITVDANLPEREVLATVFRSVQHRGRNGTGLFGLRQQAHGLAFLCEKLAVLYPDEATDAARFHRAFGRTRFLHLTRADKIAQAISYLKANQSGLWHMAPDGSVLEQTGPRREPSYDGTTLRTMVTMLTAYDRAWNDWFLREGLTPVRLSYDDLAADPAGMLHHVLDSLGLDPAAAKGIKPGVRKLADKTSLEWAARFRAEAGGE